MSVEEFAQPEVLGKRRGKEQTRVGDETAVVEGAGEAVEAVG